MVSAFTTSHFLLIKRHPWSAFFQRATELKSGGVLYIFLISYQYWYYSHFYSRLSLNFRVGFLTCAQVQQQFWVRQAGKKVIDDSFLVTFCADISSYRVLYQLERVVDAESYVKLSYAGDLSQLLNIVTSDQFVRVPCCQFEFQLGDWLDVGRRCVCRKIALKNLLASDNKMTRKSKKWWGNVYLFCTILPLSFCTGLSCQVLNW